jgi:enamine deaminase RidA (YjgF/YER057c/UK114 family)
MSQLQEKERSLVTRIHKTPIMHRSVEHNGLVFFGGIVADDTSGSMGEQTRQICRKLDASLAEAGTDKTKIVSANLFVTDMAGKEEMNRAWLEWLPAEALPARATIGVASLGTPTTLIEIVIVAAK